MKNTTKLFAVAGAVAGALLPVATFAAGPYYSERVDTLNATISPACTIDATHPAESATQASVTTINNTYTATVTPGTIENFTPPATENKFTITCNYASGYKIKAVGGDLTLDANNKISATAGAASGEPSTSFWDASITTTGNLKADATGNETSKTNFAITDGNGVVVAHNAGSSADSTGDSFSMSYRVGAKKTQKAGIYSGTVTYTLINGAS